MMASKDWYDDIPLESDVWIGWDLDLQDADVDQLVRFIDWGEIIGNLNPDLLMGAVDIEEDICLNCGEIVRMCAILDPHCVGFASPP
tara:strand:+ start:650 stop:910 length:261 start_codon:yes stop_codon:yes gene_type:complete